MGWALWLECVFSARTWAESMSFILESGVGWGWHLAKQSWQDLSVDGLPSQSSQPPLLVSSLSPPHRKAKQALLPVSEVGVLGSSCPQRACGMLSGLVAGRLESFEATRQFSL